MKKTAAALFLLLTILLTATMTSCGKADDAAPADSKTMAGSYHLVDASGVDSYYLVELKDGVRLEVRADNTATLSLMNDVHELTFDPEKMVCTSPDDDQAVPYTFDGKQIVMDTEPFRMIFER